VLAIDEPAAEVVRRVFAEYPNGLGDRAIANGFQRGWSAMSVRAAALTRTDTDFDDVPQTLGAFRGQPRP
jgi:hypothetical protein